MEKLILSFDDFKKDKKISVQNKKMFFPLDEKDIVKSADLYYSFTAQKYDDIINVTGEIKGKMGFECSRCLILFEQNVNISFNCSWTKEEFEFDLGEELRQNVILNIPAKPLCKNDCKGLCQVCGNNKNKKDCFCEQNAGNEFVAEKWSKLKNLKI